MWPPSYDILAVGWVGGRRRADKFLGLTEVDAHYNAISHQYFASGAALGGRSSKKHEEGTCGYCP